MNTAEQMQLEQPKNRNRWIILIAVGLFTFMATLDGSIVNIAIPMISKELAVNMNLIEWIVSIYIMVICVFILFFGKLGDAIGKVKIFRLGTFIFVLGSLLCGLSHSLELLLASRVVQALGASMTMATNFGIITETFPIHERGKALGLIGSFVSLGSIAGPGLGGFIIASFGWEYIFLINVPVGIITIVLGYFVLPKEKIVTKKNHMDYTGFSLFALLILSLFGGIFIGQEIGFLHTIVITLWVTFFLFSGAFLYFEKRVNDPLIDLTLFKNKDFSLGLVCALLVFCSNFFFNVLMPFYLQKTLQLTPTHAGFLIMALPFAMVIMAPVAGNLADKIGAEFLTFLGLIIITIVQFSFVFINESTDLVFYTTLVAILGLGISLFQSPNNTIIMSSVPKNMLGIAGSLNGLVRNLGMIIGIACSTTSLYLAMSEKAGYKVTTYIDDLPDLFIFGMHASFFLCFLLCSIATIITGYRLFKKKQH